MRRSEIQALAHDLLDSGHVECDFLEYKKSDQQNDGILKTICAFANNYMNREIGLLLIGVEEEDGSSGLKAVPKRPIVFGPANETDALTSVTMRISSEFVQTDARVKGLATAIADEMREPTGLSKRQGDEISDEINDETKLTSDEMRLIDALSRRPRGTYAQFADELGCSEAKVYQLTKTLRGRGVLERVGSRKSGRWIVHTDALSTKPDGGGAL